MPYMTYECRNCYEYPPRKKNEPKVSICNNSWLDEDVKGKSTPPRWKYCEECVGAGYVNTTEPLKNEKRVEIGKQLAKRKVK